MLNSIEILSLVRASLHTIEKNFVKKEKKRIWSLYIARKMQGKNLGRIICLRLNLLIIIIIIIQIDMKNQSGFFRIETQLKYLHISKLTQDSI